eukprot:CAMPEP_0177775314 /NCGR_PEP_ID=MMETSP0491_2-20121128/14026_1 /TAXON_ID=63592 /ORGANISM="Tetraselmis chuii, Strain PLY429" /LENGTH=169 /DNA_ID=CAMNT_0019293855 /DNA_START=603 /DNA_END=1112 /DNA_ORIENTATION=+
MANQSAKKRVETNAARLRMLQILILVANVFHLLLRFFIKGDSLSWFNYSMLGGTSLVYFFCYGSLHLSAEPSYNDAGELTDGGTDISMKGMCEYQHDAIYLSALLQICAGFSDRFWYSVLILPIYLAYYLWTSFISPWIFTETAEEAEANERYRQQMAGKDKRGARCRR